MDGAEWDNTGGPHCPPRGTTRRGTAALRAKRIEQSDSQRLWSRGKHRQQDALQRCGDGSPPGCGAVLCPRCALLPVDADRGNPSHGRTPPAMQLLSDGSARTQCCRCISSQPHTCPTDLGAGSWQQLAEAAIQLWLNTGEVQAGSASPCEPSSQRRSPQKEKPQPNLPSRATKPTPSQGKGC